jgi:Tol biopolymer transport system component
VLPIEGDETTGWKPGKPTTFLDTPALEYAPMFSPDGRWIAYHYLPLEDRQNPTTGGVYVQPFPAPATGEIRRAPRIDRDFQPVWSRDGKELFYVPLANAGRLASVRVMAQPSLTFASPQTFVANVIVGRPANSTRAFDTLPDGKFVGLASESETGGLSTSAEMRVWLNWFDELKARAPASR